MTDRVPLSFQRAARRDDIDSVTPLALALEGGARICLVRDGNEVYAFADRCPHRDFPLSGDDLVEPCVIECPWHGARFDVRTGAVVRGPATDPLTTYVVRVVDGDVFVGVGERVPEKSLQEQLAPSLKETAPNPSRSA